MSGAAHKHVNWWVVLLLPIFLRSLIPVGFMPMVGPHFTVQLVVCDGDGPMSASMDMPMDMSMPMSMDMPMDMSMPMSMDMPAGMVMGGDDSSAPPDHHRGHADRGSCPYGSAPALGALPALASLPALLIQRSLEPSLATAQLAFVEVSPRAQSPRGPPSRPRRFNV